MNDGSLTVALVSEVFTGPDAERKLSARLAEARALGAELALLPELPLDAWSPAAKAARDEDAEPPDGPRHRIFAEAARREGIGIAGGAIVIDPKTGARHNTALVFDAHGALRGSYRKLHLPEEPGYWETTHFQPGTEPPAPIDGFALPLGVQLCSDVNRPSGSHLLSALGAMAILVPRATERSTYDRWSVVFRANAVTSAAYVLSVTRPEPEQGVPMGGPSVAVDPTGRVLVETTDPVAVVRLERQVVLDARVAYPGYLNVRADVYARGWAEVAARRA
jgi:N-carbamoylputrescine amidase